MKNGNSGSGAAAAEAENAVSADGQRAESGGSETGVQLE